MLDKKSILLLFDGPNLAYSSTVIQLYDQLCTEYDVTILAYPPDDEIHRLSSRKVKYYPPPGNFLLSRVKFKILTFLNKNAKEFKKNNLGHKEYFTEFLFIKKLIHQNNYFKIIAVDIKNLFFCSLLKTSTDFVSLELCQNEHLIKSINPAYINSVIIQSTLRKEYLFKNLPVKVFYVQNAPVYNDICIKHERRGLIYSGTAWDPFGFYHCLNYVQKYCDETLTVQGVVLKHDREKIEANYSGLLKEKRLLIHNEYFTNEEVSDFISNFEIGFCFYNFEISWINSYNYITAPSGKLFKYLAAGVPVVGSNILGFSFVNEFNCGVLINELNEAEIRAAILKIRENYSFYVSNAIAAAKHFSFDKAIKPYLEYIKIESHD